MNDSTALRRLASCLAAALALFCFSCSNGEGRAAPSGGKARSSASASTSSAPPTSSAPSHPSQGADELPTLTSDEIQSALERAGLITSCSGWGATEPGEVDETGTVDNVRSCYTVQDGSTERTGSLTWTAYQGEASFTSYGPKCTVVQSIEESDEMRGVELSEFGAESLIGANFIVTGYRTEAHTYSNGYVADTRALTTDEWAPVLEALGGGELKGLDEYRCGGTTESATAPPTTAPASTTEPSHERSSYDLGRLTCATTGKTYIFYVRAFDGSIYAVEEQNQTYAYEISEQIGERVHPDTYPQLDPALPTYDHLTVDALRMKGEPYLCAAGD